jgi:hypothetical protein
VCVPIASYRRRGARDVTARLMDGERRASSTMPALGTRTRRDRATKKSPGAGAERQGTKRETAEDSFSVRADQCICRAGASSADGGWCSRIAHACGCVCRPGAPFAENCSSRKACRHRMRKYSSDREIHGWAAAYLPIGDVPACRRGALSPEGHWRLARTGNDRPLSGFRRLSPALTNDGWIEARATRCRVCPDDAAQLSKHIGVSR